MATSIMDKVEKPTEDEEQIEDTNTDIDLETSLSLSKEILDKEQLEKLNKIKLLDQVDDEIDEKEEYMESADSDFYTRSMDLSEQDFDLGEEFNEHGLPIGMKILIFLIFIAIIGVATYFILQG